MLPQAVCLLSTWMATCGSGATSGAGVQQPDLRPWIQRMRARRAHGGKLQDLANEHRVVVTMTTIPKRINRIEPVVDAMLAQTWPIEALYMSIPYRYNRTGERYVIPEWLLRKQGVRVVRCEDLGPGTHLLSGLRQERDPWTFLVAVDDDHIYSPTLVEELMRAALAHPGGAVAAQGFLSVPGIKLLPDSPRYLHDQGFAAGPVLVSYLGVVYQRGFFDDSIYDYSQVSPLCKYQDDMWFSAHLARKGIRRWVLGAAMRVSELRDMHLGPESLTYWEENKAKVVSETCNDALLQLYPDIWSWRRRLVLAVGGLPLLPPPPPLPPGALPAELRREAIRVQAASPPLGEWVEVLDQLRRLPYRVDLTYLCTSSAQQHLGAGERLGAAFRLRSQLVVHTDACEARVQEPRMYMLLRDALRYEGDPDTIIIAGSMQELAGASDALPLLAECAASLFTAADEPASDGAEAVDARGPGYRLPTSQVKQVVGAIGYQHHQRGGPARDVVAAPPFCRMDGLVATSAGALSEMGSPRT